MSDTVTVKAGSVVRIVTTGGGGWGDPLKREADKVVYDVQCGLITEAAAREHYGVVLRKVGRKWQADSAATEALRARFAAARGRLPMFDRGAYFAEMKKKGMVHRPRDWADPDAGWEAQPLA
jgi:N-methylhydantoinase B